MTATAVTKLETLRPSLPTAVHTLTAEEALKASTKRSISPDGRYGIACSPQPFAILFNNQTGAVIATEKYFTFCSDNAYTWAADGSFVFTFDPSGSVSRWYTADGKLETAEVHVPIDLNFNCESRAAISPDLQYLVVRKGCGIYLVRLSDQASFDHPQVIEKPFSGDVYEIRWATAHLVVVIEWQNDVFYQVPTGKRITNVEIGGGSGCVNQMPSLSPDERWMVFEPVQCGGSDTPAQLILANLEKGTQQIITKSMVDWIDFIGWKPDSSRFILIRRPRSLSTQTNPGSAYGLLEFNPQTRQFRVLNDQALLAAFPRDMNQPYADMQNKTPQTPGWVEQAWLDAFHRDFSRAFLAFPVRANDGSLTLEGALWDEATGQLSGRQVLAKNLPIDFSSYPAMAGYMVSNSGKEIVYSARVIYPPLPAVWSQDNQRLATINADHQLVVIDLNGNVRVVGQVNTNLEESNWTFREFIYWSDNDQTIHAGDQVWKMP